MCCDLEFSLLFLIIRENSLIIHKFKRAFSRLKSRAQKGCIMKKFLILVVAALLLLTLTSCSKNPNEKKTEPTIETTETETKAIVTVTEPATAAPAAISTSATIPTDGEMQTLFGFDKIGVKPVFSGKDVPWEPAKWSLQWISDKPLALKLLQGWEFTVTREDNVVAVYYGDGVTTINIKGATFRYLPAYNTPDSVWALDQKEMLKRENDFGLSRDPSYQTVMGTIPKPTTAPASTPAPKPTTTTPTPAPTPKPSSTPAKTTTPAITAQWLAKNIGGKVEKWIVPTDKNGAWVYKDKENFVKLNYPGSGRLDVWIGKAVSITLSNKALLSGLVFDEASYTP